MSLRDLAGRHRILIGRSPELDVGALWQHLDEARAELRERRLVVVVAGDDGVDWWPGPPPVDAAGLRGEIEALLSDSGSDLVLIGLDGGVKRRYAPDTFTVRELFSDIDAMPMRRAELADREE